MQKYLERRTIFSEEYLKYDENDDPNILVHPTKFDPAATAFQSLNKPISTCLKTNRKDYNKTISCIEKVTFSIEEYLYKNANNSKPRGMK